MPRFTRFAKGFQRGKKKGQNKTEEAYAAYLGTLKLAGDIADFGYEWITLKLADDTRYTPDFFVLTSDYTVEFHEVKAGILNKSTGEVKALMKDDALVKIKVAAERFPFRFKMAFLYKGTWYWKEYLE